LPRKCSKPAAGVPAAGVGDRERGVVPGRVVPQRVRLPAGHIDFQAGVSVDVPVQVNGADLDPVPDCSVTIEASQYPAMPYLSPCASSHAAAAPRPGSWRSRGRSSERQQRDQPCRGDRGEGPRHPGDPGGHEGPGREHRPARQAPRLLRGSAGRWHHGDQVRADVEDDRGEQQLLGPAGPCARSHITRARPNRAASRQISPKAAPAPPSLVSGLATERKERGRSAGQPRVPGP